MYDFGGGRSLIYPKRCVVLSGCRAHITYSHLGHCIGFSIGCGWFDEQVEPLGQSAAFLEIGPTKNAAFNLINTVGPYMIVEATLRGVTLSG